MKKKTQNKKTFKAAAKTTALFNAAKPNQWAK